MQNPLRTGRRNSTAWSVIAALTIVGAVLGVYGRTAGYGLISDDFGWLVGAKVFEPARLFQFDNRAHFYRPVVEAYFPLALAACGRSAWCYHALSITIHAINSLLVTGMGGALAGSWRVGALAGLLFAVMATPVEAVVWVSAVCELLATGFFVATVWLFRRAVSTGRPMEWAAAVTCFAGSLFSHESGITLLPMLGVSLWLLDARSTSTSGRESGALRPFLMRLSPFVPIFLAYAAIAWTVNSRNYVVNEGHYGLGVHILTNVLGALPTMFVAPREDWTMAIAAVGFAWLAIAAPQRIRFYVIWIVVTLIPFAGFHGDLPSRYYYLSTAGFAALLAESLVAVQSALQTRGSTIGRVAWAVLTVAVTVRFAVFAARNARIGSGDAKLYAAYAASVRTLHPTLPENSVLEVPAPPDGLPGVHVSSLLQWEYDDPALSVVVSPDVSGVR